MKRLRHPFVYLLIVLTSISLQSTGQGILDRARSFGSGFRGGGGGGGGTDTLTHRTGMEDSITLRFRYLDSSRYRPMDSLIDDFSKRFPIPADHIFLGNTGSASRSILFAPVMKPGWDAGFHAFDIYQLDIPTTKFYSTTRPYSELGYIIGSKLEQDINILHTQNITPDWNAAFQYNLINSPGFFRNQNTNHNSLRLNTSIQSKNRRYHLFFIGLSNNLKAAENGGIKDDQDYLNNLITYKDRSLIPVQLGNNSGGNISAFNTSVNTGTKYKNQQIFLRQQYDLGIKDSLVTDTSVIKLFYPKLRIEHTFRYSSYTYGFADQPATDVPDTLFYRRYYDFGQNPSFVLIRDQWKEMVNDLSLYQFPDNKNAQQFFKAGATVQNLRGSFSTGDYSFHNIFLHGEYRNKTRNRKWDIEANGEFYLNGFNAGDYSGLVSLKRYLGKQVRTGRGMFLQAGIQNVNRTPSFIFDNRSSFALTAQPSFNKENITNIFASLEQPHYRLKLTGSYYLVSNYTYFKDYYHADQVARLFNLLRINAWKNVRVGRRWNWDAEVTLQQKTGNVPVNVPLIYTRNRFYFKGNLGFKNLLLLFGTEVKYHTPYKADNYSPLLGQFFYQDTATIRLKMPDIAAFLHFRIKSFTAYIRAENLNTMSFRGGFGFTNNNFAAPDYPYPGRLIRVGIFWGFVN
ncbi:MAG TPA: putative porin [Chitinophagaceae bacterium]|nr:putative porin [Chitinophagaceae bacterium]